jgi:TRAP-type mannitol/chloroaromatic compound transport system permease large subunit
VVKEFVLGLNLNTVTFLLLTQVIIFILGWPLEWSEIIIIFVPIFLPLLEHFNVDPIFFGILVALNLQTSFLTPPMAMSAYYLKGVAPKEVLLSTIFKGCLPFVSMVFVAMAAMYMFPAVTNYLPDLLYGNR